MNRKDFILKGAGLLLLLGLSIAATSHDIEPTLIKYSVLSKRCDGCGHCFRACRQNALQVTKEGKAFINLEKCKGCGDCLRFCKRMAIIEKKVNVKK
jgi:MinD superfamily P-loop ATPase